MAQYQLALNDKSTLNELFGFVKKIPIGKVVTYGSLGRILSKPVSGLLVGKWIASAPKDVPWWRVVSKSGDLPVSKRDPLLGIEQMQRLKGEGVGFIEDQVDTTRYMISAHELLD